MTGAPAQTANNAKPEITPGNFEPLFDYDSKAPPDIREKSIVEKEGVKIVDLTYASPSDGRVPAYVVQPPATKGQYAGIIFLHRGDANREQFLPEAITYAKAGAVSILIDSPNVRPAPWQKSDYSSLTAYTDNRIQAVKELRRAVDLLVSRYNVDSSRMAFVGHSYGQAVGGVLAGVERRFKTFILMAGMGSQIEFWRNSPTPAAEGLRKQLQPERFEAFLKTLEPVEQIRYVSKAAPAALFFQFTERDEYIKKEDFQKYFAAASEPKAQKWYDANHNGVEQHAQARKDRAEWLAEKIGLKKAVLAQTAAAR